MKYLSDDGIVFDSNKECLEHENSIRRKIEEERIRKEKLEMERQNRLDAINKKYEELQDMVIAYGKDYCVCQKPYFAPSYELMDMLCE